MKVLHSHTVPNDIGKVRFSDYCELVFTSIPSRKGIRKAIKRGALRLDGEVCGTGVWVKAGQVIALYQLDIVPPKTYDLDMEVLFEDHHCAVIHKPPGIIVSGNQFRTVENTLQGNLFPSNAPDALNWPRPVHRLDSGTSGLLVIAKTYAAIVDLGKQFEAKTIRKRYRAVVMGRPPESGTVDSPIEGKPSTTEFSVVKSVPSLRSGHLTLVDLYPLTGRTHQLRIHMASLGHPILGDKEYGSEGLILKGKGIFLSAVELHFVHPVNGEAVGVSIEQPLKFERFMAGELGRWERYGE